MAKEHPLYWDTVSVFLGRAGTRVQGRDGLGWVVHHSGALVCREISEDRRADTRAPPTSSQSTKATPGQTGLESLSLSWTQNSVWLPLASH